MNDMILPFMHERFGRYAALIASVLAIALGQTNSIAAQSENLTGGKNLPDINLPASLGGQAAIQALGRNLPLVAAAHRMSAEKLQRTLAEDRSAMIDRRGRLYYVETEIPSPQEASVMTSDLVVAAGATIPLENTFLLHSHPGASKIIYLDFDGFAMSGTAWNDSYNAGNTIQCPPWDIDGNPSVFSDAERTIIQNVWKRVAEDYAPFNVDVTTEFPGETGLTRSSSTDANYGMRVLISPISSYFGNYGGVAFVTAFDETGDYYKPALVFPENLGNNAKNIAEACSHECGHTLGLLHDGSSTTAYYAGHGSGETGWAPIMGVGYSKNLTQWSKGEYPGANNTEDDLAIIAGYLGYASDDYGNTIATATVLPVGTQLLVSGTVERNTDVDVFQFTTGAGTVTVNAAPADLGPNLDIAISLYDGSGMLISSNNPVDLLGCSLTAALNAGAYYLQVKGAGKGDPLNGGYSSYGSLGQYTISGTVVDPKGVLPAVTVSATDAVAGEPGTGQGTGTFTFSRTGSTVAALTVNFTLGGTGISGTDYTSIGTTVSFASASATATKLVSVLDDTLVEGDETVVVTLASGSGYTVGAPSSATVTIKDDDRSLAEALDVPGWTWTTGGNTPAWVGQTVVTHDGMDAARSGVIGNNQTNWIETAVTGPGTLSFWWKVSSEATYDFVRFFVNGVQQASRSGEGDWAQASYALGAGTQTLRWAYTKDPGVIGGQDAAWVDQVSFAPLLSVWTLSVASVNPSSGVSITVSPSDNNGQGNGTTAFARTYSNNAVVTFTASTTAGGNTFQRWQKDGVDFSTNISTSLTMDASHTLTAVYQTPTMTLVEALDTPGWTWTTGGNTLAWFGQTTLTHDGVDAARSGAIGNNQTNWIQSLVNGPGTLSFWWKVSSETNYDFLRFAVDGVEQARISGEAGWVMASFAVAAGSHTLRWAYTKDPGVIGGQDAAWVDQVSFTPVSPPTLVEALDTPGWTWTTGGNTLAWFGQTTLTHDGVDAARSGAIGNNQTNWIETLVTGPGTLSFWWKVSSETNYDFVRFFVNAVQQASRSGEGDWAQASYALGAGTQTLRWAYTKDPGVIGGQDAAWVDQVSFAAGAGLSGASDVQLILTLSRMERGRFRLSMTGPAGRECHILASSNLADWTVIGETTIGEDGLAEFIDSTLAPATTRFYQVVITGLLDGEAINNDRDYRR
jgi:hypothetical protein